jgi:hypothetical protein
MPGVNELAYKSPQDTNERFVVQDDGKLQWGSGAALPDIILQRSAANTLTLTGALTQTTNTLTINDVGLTRVGAGQLQLNGVITTTQAAVPTIPSPAAGWGTISFATGSTDTAGAITFTVSGTPAASAVAMPVVFSRTYATAPKSVQLTMGDSSVNDPITIYYVTALATTGFTIATNATGAAQAAKILLYAVSF